MHRLPRTVSRAECRTMPRLSLRREFRSEGDHGNRATPCRSDSRAPVLLVVPYRTPGTLNRLGEECVTLVPVASDAIVGGIGVAEESQVVVPDARVEEWSNCLFGGSESN